MKTCSKCNVEKELKHFSIRKDTKKYRNQCRKCSKGYSRLLGDSQKEIDKDFSNGLKRCGKCTDLKSVKEFNKDKTTRTGYTSLCKKCKAEWNSLNKKENAKRAAKYRYGITDKEYHILMSKDTCSICESSFDDDKIIRAIDHCHDSGNVRGMICRNCNIGLGNFKDDINVLASAIRYLSKYK